MLSDQPTNLEAEIKAGSLIRWLKHLGATVSEAKFRIEHDGIAVRAVDPANVEMVDANLSVSAFETWHYDRLAAWPGDDDPAADDDESDDDTETCAGTTADGDPCSRDAGDDGYCHQHGDDDDESDADDTDAEETDDADDAEETDDDRPDEEAEAVADGGDPDGDDDDDTDDDDPPLPRGVRKDSLVIGVNLRRLSNLLMAAAPDDTIRLELYCAASTMIVRYNGHEHVMRLIDPDSIRSEPDIPDLDLGNEWSVDAEVLQDALVFTDNISDHTQFRSEYPNAWISAEGDTDEYERELDQSDLTWHAHTEESERSLFSNDYLRENLRTFGKNDTLTVRHGHEFPLFVSGEIPRVDGDDDADPAGEVRYMLAPRIQSD